MKFTYPDKTQRLYFVASLAEAWIEITVSDFVTRRAIVASLAEAWIEIDIHGSCCDLALSPPSRRRGLKFMVNGLLMMIHIVASLAEAWIEIFAMSIYSSSGRVASLAEAWIEIHEDRWIYAGRRRRLPRGGVD